MAITSSGGHTGDLPVAPTHVTRSPNRYFRPVTTIPVIGFNRFMNTPLPAALPANYRIEVLGRLGENWLPCFEGMVTTCAGEVTTLTGPVADQAALRGLLCWLWDLNLTVLSVSRVDGVPPREG